MRGLFFFLKKSRCQGSFARLLARLGGLRTPAALALALAGQAAGSRNRRAAGRHRRHLALVVDGAALAGAIDRENRGPAVTFDEQNKFALCRLVLNGGGVGVSLAFGSVAPLRRNRRAASAGGGG